MPATPSPALVQLTGQNFLRRTVDDAIYATNGLTALSVVIVLDPRITYFTGVSGTLVAKHNATGDQRQWRLVYDQATAIATIELYDAPGPGAVLCSRAASVAVTRRQIIGFTYNGTVLDIYVDGVLANGALTGSVPATLAASTAGIGIGAEAVNTTPVQVWRGAIYAVGIWNFALSGADHATVLKDGVIPPALLAGGYAPMLAFQGSGIVQVADSIRLASWTDVSGNGRTLTPHMTAGEHPPCLLAAGGRLFLANRWDASLNDTGDLVLGQGLSSTYTLTPPYRVWGVSFSLPTRANYRGEKHDFTVMMLARRVLGTTDSILIRIYGVQLQYTLSSQEMFAFVGNDAGAGNKRVSFGTGLFPVEGIAADFILRYNAADDTVDFFIGSTMFAQSESATASKYVGTDLLLSDRADFSTAVIVPRCLSDAQVTQLRLTSQQQAHSSLPGTFAGGLIPHPLYANLEEAEVVAVPAPLTEETVDQSFAGFALPDVGGFAQLGGISNPYGISEAPARRYGDPVPIILTVIADVSKVITVTAEAGPTDASPTVHWYEVELATGGLFNAVGPRYLGTFFFTERYEDVRNIQIPIGQDWNGLRIRMAVQAVLDGSQFWFSPWVVMNGFNFDNSGGLIFPTYVFPTPVINTVSIHPDTRVVTLEGVVGEVTSDLIANPAVEIWWEVAITPGEYVAVIDTRSVASIVTPLTVQDTFVLPAGTNIRGKPMRLVVSGRYDRNQRVQSVPFLLDDAAWDYSIFSPQPLPPGPALAPGERPPVGLVGPGVRNKRTLDFTTRR